MIFYNAKTSRQNECPFSGERGEGQNFMGFYR